MKPRLPSDLVWGSEDTPEDELDAVDGGTPVDKSEPDETPEPDEEPEHPTHQIPLMNRTQAMRRNTHQNLAMN